VRVVGGSNSGCVRVVGRRRIFRGHGIQLCIPCKIERIGRERDRKKENCI